jgi:RNA polymerase sigma factor (sigma-70 family)
VNLLAEIEQVLWDYQSMKINLEELACTEESYDCSCDKDRVMGGDSTSRVERLAVRRADYQRYIKVVDRMVSLLPPLERNFVDFRYMKGMHMDDVAEKLNISDRHVRRVKTRILRKLAIAFGWRSENSPLNVLQNRLLG